MNLARVLMGFLCWDKFKRCVGMFRGDWWSLDGVGFGFGYVM